MPDEQQTDRRTRRGYLIMVALLASAIIIFNVDAIADLTRDHLDIVAVVPEAAGIRVGSAVWVEGVESGRVTALSFLPHEDRAEVAVHVRLEARTRDVIREDSDAGATRLRFIGQPIVVIHAGSADAPPIDSGDTIRSIPRLSPREVLERGLAFPSTLDSLVSSSRRITELVQARQPELTMLSRRLDALTAAASELSDAMEGGSLGLMMADDGLATRLSRLGSRLGEVQEAIGSLDRYRPDDGPDAGPLARELAALQRRIDSVTASTAALQARLEAGEGMIPRMQRDSALEVAVTGLQARVDSLIAEVQSIALRMLLP